MSRRTRVAHAALVALAFASAPAFAQTYTRTDDITYEDNLTLWVVNQQKSSTNVDTGLIESRTEYDPATALPLRTYAFEALQAIHGFWPDGALRTTTDANGRTTFLGDYKRGIPRLIGYADGTSKSAVVDDYGLIRALTDETGATTCYDFDAIGRMAKITYPTESTGACGVVDWTATTSSFVPVATPEYGLAAGHWRGTVRTGNGVKKTYYDGFWRPVVEDTFDEADIANTLSQAVTRYDSSGNVAFKSSPKRGGFTDYTVVVQGVRTFYDTLDRPIRVEQDSELGVLATTTEYLAGFQTRTTNPRGFKTTTGYQVYDQPSTDLPTQITQPESTITDISRDVFGKPQRIRRTDTQRGLIVDRWYTYDTVQRLCKTIEPETASTVNIYDAAGNVTWTASGLALDSTAGGGQCDVDRSAALASGRAVERGYDARNRPASLKFPDGLGDQVLAYAPDGQLANVTTWNDAGHAAPVVNTYAYNKRRLLIEERSQQPGWYDWGLVLGYDANGFLRTQRFPDGVTTIDFAPNALGQTTAVRDQVGTNYATNAKYYPNGGLQQFTYGNGVVHTMQQNARQLPARVTDGVVSDFTYTFDANGNPSTIRDVNAVDGVYSGNRDLYYDGRDRLTRAHLHTLMYDDFGYDALDNIRAHYRYSGAGTVARDYVYDAANRLTNLVEPATSGSVVGLGYDAQGNLANKNGQVFRFDYGNRLRMVDGKGAYRYDAHGRRVMAWSPAGNVASMYDRNGSLAYDHNDATQKDTAYVYLSGSLIATREVQGNSVVTKFHHTDALGSPVAVTDQSGQVVDRTLWKAYGAAINKPGYNGIGYTGHVMDGGTGMTYMQQRYYDALLGRFLSVDPVMVRASGDNFNRYWYANNNPYRFTDPDGRQTIPLSNQLGTDDPQVQQSFMALRFEFLLSLVTGTDAGAAAPKGSGAVQSGVTPAEFAVGGGISRGLGALRSASALADGALVGGPKLVTPAMVESSLAGSTMKTTQDAISLPVVQRYVTALESGSPAPAIKVADGVIVDGNHRYVAGRILGQEPVLQPSTIAPSQIGQAKPIYEIKIDLTDWGNR